MGVRWIFGLKYHHGVLAYTLAFEAEVHLQNAEGEKVYKYDLIGKGPRSGGDTHNAVEAVDDEVYFGGWVHAPAIYEGRIGKGGKILFNNKFSHLHSYDTKEDRVRLLWSDTLAHESKWAGEVSQITYDPVGDRLLVARADGHEHLGVFAVDRRNGKAERISETPALKGTLHLDYICFDIRRDWTKGVEGIQTLDLVTGKWSEKDIDFARDSIDGGGAYWPGAGCSISAYSRLFFFVRGGVLVGDPLGDLEEMRFVRLFDFGTDYSPSRTVCKSVGGGILVAFSTYSQSFLHPRNEFETSMKNRANFVNGPSVLLYITPPQARVVMALGGRITIFEKVGDRLVVAASTSANLGADDATPIDTGYRDLSVFDLGSILNDSPPLIFDVLGEHVMDGAWVDYLSTGTGKRSCGSTPPKRTGSQSTNTASDCQFCPPVPSPSPSPVGVNQSTCRATADWCRSSSGPRTLEPGCRFASCRVAEEWPSAPGSARDASPVGDSERFPTTRIEE